jgi:hypothetical protein
VHRFRILSRKPLRTGSARAAAWIRSRSERPTDWSIWSLRTVAKNNPCQAAFCLSGLRRSQDVTHEGMCWGATAVQRTVATGPVNKTAITTERPRSRTYSSYNPKPRRLRRRVYAHFCSGRPLDTHALSGKPQRVGIATNEPRGGDRTYVDARPAASGVIDAGGGSGMRRGGSRPTSHATRDTRSWRDTPSLLHCAHPCRAAASLNQAVRGSGGLQAF